MSILPEGSMRLCVLIVAMVVQFMGMALDGRDREALYEIAMLLLWLSVIT